ncbi:unnamed protein product [Lymnaea stagnalis]|uniref:P/Homo B domain-containing protein n=1 Tax=Lymnaea stagnalis TaxID=6523 RepID=A0AAV2HKZ7_LYMST
MGVTLTAWLFGTLLTCYPIPSVLSAADDLFLNLFAVRLKNGSRETAEIIARHHGFLVKNELPHINVFMLEYASAPRRSRRGATDLLNTLKQDDRVKHAQQEVTLHRVKRRVILHDKQLELPIRTIEDDSVFARVVPPNLTQRDGVYRVGAKFNDPKFNDMWYLVNQGQSGGEAGVDMNMAIVWSNGFTGKGVVVCILDDGIDHSHPDLINNYVANASTDLNDQTDYLNDPMPDTSNTDNSHGTRCAGEVAASANNGVCGVGVAYEASIGGVRILDGIITDALEAEALTFNNDFIDIYSASWGPSDDGAVMEGPSQLTSEALGNGVKYGRHGLGSIFVWATGNGGINQDDCNADGYVNMPETLAVGSVNERGLSPFFAENCTSTLAVVPSGGGESPGQEEETGRVKLKVVTTDINDGCIENFQGTSSAAPLAAGCVANILQANPTLSWRDIQHVVVNGARITSDDNSWFINGAGHHVSHRFGFGLMDCGRMIELAQMWDNVSAQRRCHAVKAQIVNKNLSRRGKIIKHVMTDACRASEQDAVDRLEHVQVHIQMFSKRRGDMLIALISPARTRSVLLAPRPKDDFRGEWEFTFMTVHNWDENPGGMWTLEIVHTLSVASSDAQKPTGFEPRHKIVRPVNDVLKSSDPGVYEDDDLVGFLKSWSLDLLGTKGSPHNRGVSGMGLKAVHPSAEQVKTIKKQEFERSQRVQIKRVETSSVDKTRYGDGVTDKSVTWGNGSSVHLDTEVIRKRKLDVSTIMSEEKLQKANIEEIKTVKDEIINLLKEIQEE